MLVNIPTPSVIANRIAPDGQATLTIFQLQAELERVQRYTMIAVADCMDAAASQFERLKKEAITPADLRLEAQKLRAYANGGGCPVRAENEIHPDWKEGR